MGFFDKLLGRVDPKTPWKHWAELYTLEKLSAAAEALLNRVAEQLGLERTKIKRHPEGVETVLRGSTHGIRYRVKLDAAAWPRSSSSTRATISKASTSTRILRKARPGRGRRCLGRGRATRLVTDQVHIEGSSAREEAARFRELPAELQSG